jgi:hypothetical protein
MRIPVLLAITGLLAAAHPAIGQCHELAALDIDMSPQPGVPPDGSPEFCVDCELLELGYDKLPPGTGLTTMFLGPQMFPYPHDLYRVSVRNLSEETTHNVVLTIENYGCFFGDPTGWIFLYETVWDPPALAGGNAPAYPLGDLLPGQETFVEVKLLWGFELPIFDGAFNAGSIGFDSTASIPGFSDASVLLSSGELGDIDGDCTVGIVDFMGLLARWGACPQPCPPFCPGDFDGDCQVGITDFTILLANWD